MEHKMYTDREEALIRELEKCNYEYLLTKENEQRYLRKSKLDYARFKKSFDFKKAKRKYMKLYGLESFADKANELGWDKKKSEQCLYLRSPKKTVVYTCISGKYDSGSEPRFIQNPNISYVMYTNQNIKSEVWEVRPIPESLNELTDVQKNRYLKMHPHEFFRDYDYAIYIDGNVQVISDMSGLANMIDETVGFAMHTHRNRNCLYQEAVFCQIYRKGNSQGITDDVRRYQSEGFPKSYGLLECTVFAVDLHSEVSKKIFEEWWKEFLKASSCRDQLSLPYVLWKNDISIEKCGTMGANLYRNPKFRVLSHIK
ncbi:glycosyltransferase domain-containing protein [Ruminococcus flavefaciens]|nr:glycosyltransferase domain-containing protein [Ruminococcus flavefaciens]